MKKMLFFFLLIAFMACKKDEPAEIKVSLTDAPGDYKEVNIDLRDVQVKSDKGPWQSLATFQGIYNLLQLTNGVDTLIASGPLTEGRIKQLRLILGINNTLVLKDNSVYPLQVPSGSESGLKIIIGKEITENANLLIDFDADKSIVQTSDTSYILKPVIKLK